MKSPFPGMDPYIEACALWRDFQQTLIGEICRTLRETLPKKYLARMGKRSYIVLAESEEKRERHFEPDVTITTPRKRAPSQSAGEGSATAAVATEEQSITMTAFFEEEFNESFLDIYELEPERRLVTSLEVLSPSNKIKGSKGWKLYLKKRQALLLGKANLVEIDLLRGGTRMPMVQPWPDCPSYVLVAREQWAPECRVWKAYFDRPLPTIPIPLSRPDADIPLPLQALLDGLFEPARYAEDIDYSRPLTPPLTAEQRAWLEGRLRSGEQAAPVSPPRKPRRKRKP